MYWGDILYINIRFLIDYWYCCFTFDFPWQIENPKSDREVVLGFGPKQQYLTYLSARNKLEMLIAIKRLSFVLSCSYNYARDR